jgi:hypothetical protein
VEEVILGDDEEEDGNHSIRNKEADGADNLNEQNVNSLNEPNGPNEPNNPNEHQNVPYRYVHSSVFMANQELELPNSHAVILRFYLSRLVKSGKLSRKLKAKIMNAKQYCSSPLATIVQCSFDSSSVYVDLCGQASLTVGCCGVSCRC